MILQAYVAAALAALAIPSVQASSEAFGPSTKVAARRGPQIFNSVYDSLRKWGAVVHPNGMSLFLATVPEGTMFYHGNNRNATPTELDWLAYDIEHAEMFARSHKGGPPPEKDDKPGELKRGEDAQAPLDGSDAQTDTDGHGWLHTYRASRPLKFLYIDGMSGNKGSDGVIDTQDFLLRGVRDLDDGPWERPKNRAPGPRGEQQRAKDLCNLCEDWGLQGVIRTESPGFEIIKCDFFDGLEQVQSLQRSDSNSGPPGGRPGRGGRHGPGGPPGPPGPGGPPGGPGGPGGGFRRSAKDRYREISTGRTILDYSSMVSAYFFPVNLTNPDPEQSKYPRLISTTEDEMAAVKYYLSRVIQNRYDAQPHPFTWRDAADIIVRRYAENIKLMANEVESAEEIASYLRFLLEVYIDYSVEDKMYRDAAAQERCATFYIQTMPLKTEIDRLIYAAFKAVNAEICSTLFSVRSRIIEDADTSAKALKDVKAELKSLIEYLDWNLFEEVESA